MRTGYVQVYTGDGKGKTTAALGLALRASGYAMKTYIAQFMKGIHYGELAALRKHPHITIEQFGDVHCIRRDDVTPAHAEQARRGLRSARDAMHSGDYDIVVLDEINVTLWFGLLKVPELMRFLDERPDHVEVVCTGCRAPSELLDRADLITEMRMVKHYYDRGVSSREGIER